MRPEVDRLGKDSAQELRLRLGKPPVLILKERCVMLSGLAEQEDLSFAVNTACRYSPWLAETMAEGYLTAPGGHRIGICGETVVKEGSISGIRNMRSLNIRIARDFPGVAKPLAGINGNILLLGPPGSGKTTLLRDLIRLRSHCETVAVADERGEIFPQGLAEGHNVDILTGCSKPKGIEILLRTMSPDTIAVDEITAQADCDALLQTIWCGVHVLATLHGNTIEDLRSRRVYRPILETGLFDTLVILRRDKSFRTERLKL